MAKINSYTTIHEFKEFLKKLNPEEQITTHHIAIFKNQMRQKKWREKQKELKNVRKK